MPRDITVTFEDGATHVYRGAPDGVTPEAVQQRAQKEFGKAVTALDGGRKAAGLAAVDSGGRGEMVAEGLRPSNLAGAGRSASVGGLMPGEIPAEGLDPARRGTMRAARPFVAGDERVVAPPEAFRPPPFRTRDAGVSVLDQPAPTQHERLLDRRQQEARPFDPYDTAGNIAASRNPDQAVAADAQARDAARRAAEQSAAEQEARAKIAKTPGWLGDSSAGTAAAAVAQWAPNLVHMVGSLWNVAGAGAFDNTLRVLEKSADSLDEAKSREMRRDAAKLRAMLADPNATGADVAVFIATHPGKLADEIAAAVPSMLLAAGGGGALGALGTRAVSGAALKAGMNPAALQAEMAALRTKMAGLGAGASNVAINAGDTFSDPRLARESILDRLNAAAIAGAGTVLAGRATAGGAERAIATGARPGALRLGTRESGQEIIENTAQSAGVAAGSEAEAFDPNSAAKEAVLAGAAGFGAGAGPAALASRRADPYTQAAATGFIVDPPLATDQPQVQRKKTEAILDNVAAMYGIPPKVVQMLRAGAEGKPLADLGPAYARGIEWLQQRGLVPTEIAPEVMQALGHGAIAPPPQVVEPAKPSPAPAPGAGKGDAAVSGIESTLRAAGALPQGALAGMEDFEAPTTPSQNAEQPAAAPVAESQAPAPSEPGDGGAAPTLAGGGPQLQAPRLQNRNRSDAAYVQQMQSISANPDPGRLGFSRDFASGAPVVLDAGSTPGAAYGRTDYVTSSKGRRLPVRYAVVEAASLLPSNTADGAKVIGYEEGLPERARVVAGNGRAAGLVAGYGKGKADAYRSGLAEDAALHGIDAETLARFRQPALVREMRTEDVTADIGDESNVSGIAERSAPEVARDDARRIDLAALEFDEEGGITDATLRGFIDAQPVSEQTALRDARGNPTRQAHDRLTSAIFAAAYDNDALLALQAQATEPEARTVLAGLVAAAPQMVQLRGMGDLDIRPIVAEAAVAAVNARRRGISLADMASQTDLDASPETAAVVEMFARNVRSARKIGDSLRAAANLAHAEASKPAEDMFGQVPKRSREEVLRESTDDTAGSKDLEQQAGAKPHADDAGRRGAQAGASRGRAGAQEERPADQERAAQEDLSAAATADADTARPKRPRELIELRKRLSVLESLRACLAS